MKTLLIALTFFSALALADDSPTPPAPKPEEAQASIEAAIAYECTATNGKEIHALEIKTFTALAHREPALRMKVGGSWMSFTASEMNGKENTRMLNLAIQAADKKGRAITAQRSEYYGPPPTIKGLYVRIAFGKAAITCEMK